MLFQLQKSHNVEFDAGIITTIQILKFLRVLFQGTRNVSLWDRKK
jgi:hypothetical protein